MAFDPSDPSYSRLARTGTAQGPGSLIEKAMLISLDRASRAGAKFFKALSSSKTTKAIKESTKLFNSIRKAGGSVKALTETFRLTQTLLGMPTRTATQGLDMLTAQLAAPITGALTQSIGMLSASLNQIMGPALQQIGAAVGGFIRANAMGAGVGGMIGGIAEKVTGIPGLGIIGGLVGGGIEALYKWADEQGMTAGAILEEVVPEMVEQFPNMIEPVLALSEAAEGLPAFGSAGGMVSSILGNFIEQAGDDTLLEDVGTTGAIPGGDLGGVATEGGFLNNRMLIELEGLNRIARMAWLE